MSWTFENSRQRWKNNWQPVLQFCQKGKPCEKFIAWVIPVLFPWRELSCTNFMVLLSLLLPATTFANRYIWSCKGSTKGYPSLGWTPEEVRGIGTGEQTSQRKQFSVKRPNWRCVFKSLKWLFPFNFGRFQYWLFFRKNSLIFVTWKLSLQNTPGIDHKTTCTSL